MQGFRVPLHPRTRECGTQQVQTQTFDGLLTLFKGFAMGGGGFPPDARRRELDGEAVRRRADLLLQRPRQRLLTRQDPVPQRVGHTGISLIRNRPPPGSYSRTMPRALRWPDRRADLLLQRPRQRLHRERESFIDNLLVRIHFIIVMIRWTSLVPWEFEFPRLHSPTVSASHIGSAKQLVQMVKPRGFRHKW